MVNITDPEIQKLKRKLRWLRWKGGVLLREAQIMQKLRKPSEAQHHHPHHHHH